MGHAFVASAESPRVISPSTCRRQVEMLGMTKESEALPFGVMVVTTTSQTLFGCWLSEPQVVWGYRGHG
jgi:hypothetical protein